MKTEFIPEISNKDKQEIELLKLTLMQYEELVISMETSDRNRHLKKDMKLAEIIDERDDWVNYYEQTRKSYHDLGLVKIVQNIFLQIYEKNKT